MTGLKQVLKLRWDIANKSRNNSNNDNGQTTTTTITDDKTRIQALALANDCYKYIMDLTTNGVVITDAIKFVQTNKEKKLLCLTRTMIRNLRNLILMETRIS
jgi:hypothetical protein